MPLFHSYCMFLLNNFKYSESGDIELETLRAPGEYRRRRVVRVVGDGQNLVYHEEIHLSLAGTAWMVYKVIIRRTLSDLVICSETVSELSKLKIDSNGESRPVPSALTY